LSWEWHGVRFPFVKRLKCAVMMENIAHTRRKDAQHDFPRGDLRPGSDGVQYPSGLIFIKGHAGSGDRAHVGEGHLRVKHPEGACAAACMTPDLCSRLQHRHSSHSAHPSSCTAVALCTLQLRTLSQSAFIIEACVLHRDATRHRMEARTQVAGAKGTLTTETKVPITRLCENLCRTNPFQT
jgi:hypothetical protein